MTTLSVSEHLLPHLDHVEGETLEDKLFVLLNSHIARQLQECEREIGEYEVKYGMVFQEFSEAWNADQIPNRWSHAVERDYMEWEGLEAEKERWLSLLREILMLKEKGVSAISSGA